MAWLVYVGAMNQLHHGWEALTETERQAWEATADAVVESAMVEWSEDYDGGVHPASCRCADCSVAADR